MVCMFVVCVCVWCGVCMSVWFAYVCGECVIRCCVCGCVCGCCVCMFVCVGACV